MINITFASGDYRDTKFPIVPDRTALTLKAAKKLAKKNTTADFAIYWEDGVSTLTDLEWLKNGR